MTRYSFGGGPADYVISTTGAPVPNAQVTHWSAQTGGTQYTDLREEDATTVISGGVITCDAYGSWRAFKGPDEIKTMYVQAGAGPRRRVTAVDVTVTPTVVPAGATVADVVVMDSTGAWPSAYVPDSTRAILAILHPAFVGQSQVSVPTSWSTTAKALAIYPERTVAAAPDVAMSAPATTGLTVSVSATASSTSGASITGFAWAFGDGATATGSAASHTYSAAGTYTISVTVTDSSGLTAATSVSVTVAAPTGGSGMQAPMGMPARPIEVYLLTAAASSGNLTTATTDVNDVILAYAVPNASGNLALADYTSLGKTALVTALKGRRDAGCRVTIGVGGGVDVQGLGGTIGGVAGLVSPTKVITDLKAIVTDLGLMIDGVDLVLQHTVDAATVVTVAQALRSSYGAAFTMSITIPGTASAAVVTSLTAAAKALQDAGLLGRLAYNCYGVDWSATNWYDVKLVPIFQAMISGGVQAGKLSIGMQIGATTTTWTETKAQTAISGLMGLLGVYGSTFYHLNTAGLSTWAADMKSAVGTTAPTTNPTASFTQTLTGNTVAVDASASTAVGTSISTYKWDWGDGTTTTGTTTTTSGNIGAKAAQFFGTPRSGLRIGSGYWTGGDPVSGHSASRVIGFGSWRGRLPDVVTIYAAPDDSLNAGNAGLFNGSGARLNWGVPIIGTGRSWTLAQVASGAMDAKFQAMADGLIAAGHSNAFLRIGWEAQLQDWAWQATYANRADWKAAFQRIATVMRAKSSGFVTVFGIAIGSAMSGGPNRLSVLNDLYPGDAYVDIIEGDIYDFYNTNCKNQTQAEWDSNILTNSSGPGLQDLVDFARAHGKGASLGEWGCHNGPTTPNVGRDNPFFVQQMYNFLVANADVMAYEAVFSEWDTYIANSLYVPVNLTAAAAKYKELWGGAGALTAAAGGTTTTVAKTASHLYAAAGSYTITLTVTDSNGRVGTTTRTVTIGSISTGPSGNILFSEGFDATETLAALIARPTDQTYGGSAAVTPSLAGSRALSPTTGGLVAPADATTYGFLSYPVSSENRAVFFKLAPTGTNTVKFACAVKASGDWLTKLCVKVDAGLVSLAANVNYADQANSAGTIPFVAGNWYRATAVAEAGGTRMTVTNLTTNASINYLEPLTVTSAPTWFWWDDGAASTLTAMAVGAL